MTSRRALWGLIIVSGLLRLSWAASIGPGNDEAYHYLFTVHPALSYFDHPPMLALIEAAGISMAGGSVSTFSLRLGFVLLFAGSTWLMARLTSRFHGDRAGLLAAFALNVSAYHTAAAGAFALPDGPLLFFWLLTLDRLTVALGLDVEADSPGSDSRGATWPWIGVGLAWGCGMLSKYHAIFLPAGVLLYLAIEPKARGWLRKPGPYLAAIVGIAVFSPVLAWNASHGWVSFLFQAGRAVGESTFRPETLVGALLLPALYLFPWIWARLVQLLIGRLTRFFAGRATSVEKFLMAQAVLPLGTFLVVASRRAVLPHWTLVGFLPLLPLLGELWRNNFEVNRSRFRRKALILAAMPVFIAILAVIQSRTGYFQKGRPGGIGLVAAKEDPTVDTVGWDTIASELQHRGLLDDPNTFLFTWRWYESAHLGFATRGSRTPVLCYHAWDARSFAFWSRPEEWIGRDGILVLVNGTPAEPDRFAKWFDRIEPIGSFDIVRSGSSVRNIRLYRCVRQGLAFPFDDLGSTIKKGSNTVEKRVAAGTDSEVVR